MAEGRDPARLTVIAAIALLCAGAVTLIVMTLVGADSDDSSARAMLTALTVVFFLLTATAGATLPRGRPELAWFGYLTAAVSLAALAGTVYAIWGDPGEGAGKAIGIGAILSLAGAHSSLLLGPRYRDSGNRIRLLRNATLLLLATLAAMIVYAIAAEDAPDARLTTILVIVYALGSMVLPIAMRSAARSTGDGPRVAEGRSALELLRGSGYALVDSPGPREGSRGAGHGALLRDPEGHLVELISYEESEPAREPGA